MGAGGRAVLQSAALVQLLLAMVSADPLPEGHPRFVLHGEPHSHVPSRPQYYASHDGFSSGRVSAPSTLRGPSGPPPHMIHSSKPSRPRVVMVRYTPVHEAVPRPLPHGPSRPVHGKYVPSPAKPHYISSDGPVVKQADNDWIPIVGHKRPYPPPPVKYQPHQLNHVHAAPVKHTPVLSSHVAHSHSPTVSHDSPAPHFSQPHIPNFTPQEFTHFHTEYPTSHVTSHMGHISHDGSSESFGHSGAHHAPAHHHSSHPSPSFSAHPSPSSYTSSSHQSHPSPSSHHHSPPSHHHSPSSQSSHHPSGASQTGGSSSTQYVPVHNNNIELPLHQTMPEAQHELIFVPRDQLERYLSGIGDFKDQTNSFQYGSQPQETHSNFQSGGSQQQGTLTNFQYGSQPQETQTNSFQFGSQQQQDQPQSFQFGGQETQQMQSAQTDFSKPNF